MSALRVEWTNFRGLKAGTELEFPALTILIGRNNVGKTSAYAPLLAMRQTLDAQDSRTALLGRGPLIDIGRYTDYIVEHDTDRELTLELSLPKPALASRGRGRPAAATVSTTFAFDENQDCWVKRQSILDTDGEELIHRRRSSPDGQFDFKSSLLPANTSVGRPLKEVSELRATLREEQPHGFVFSGIGGLILPREWREDEERWAKMRAWFNATSDLFHLQSDLGRALQTQLRRIAYVGPLRSLPRRTYRLTPERPRDVGRDGQFAPEILYRDGGELREGVDRWLRKLGYGTLRFKDQTDEYFQLHLAGPSGSSSVNVAHSGTGVSQLLPVLVQGLSAPRDATVIVQQPEIHLNPAQQTVIGDFLASEALNNDRRVIVETHSEHLLLRIRRRVAEGLLRAEDVAIYYFEKRSGKTAARRVPVGRAGEIDPKDWPEGFFADALDDALALAAAQAKRRQEQAAVLLDAKDRD